MDGCQVHPTRDLPTLHFAPGARTAPWDHPGCRRKHPSTPRLTAVALSGSESNAEEPDDDQPPADFLWAAELEGQAVGIIGVAHQQRHILQICRFRIDPLWQHTAVLTKLIQCVRDFCWDHGCLKVLVEVGRVPQWVLASFGRRGFHFMRQKVVGGKKMLEFYVDLYHHPRLDDA